MPAGYLRDFYPPEYCSEQAFLGDRHHIKNQFFWGASSDFTVLSQFDDACLLHFGKVVVQPRFGELWCELTDGNQVEMTKRALLEDEFTLRLLGWFLSGTAAAFPPADRQGVAGAQEIPLLLPLLPG